MKLVEKNRESKKFILAEESDAFTFRISDDYSSQFFNLSTDELRALRDVISNYIQEKDKNMFNSLNMGLQTSTSSTSTTENFMNLPPLNFDNFPTTSTTQNNQEKKEEEKIVFEFF